MAVTVFLADDHPVVLAGLTTLTRMAPEFEVTGITDRGDTAIEDILRLRPDIAVLDLNMPGLTALEVLVGIRKAGLPTKVVLLTAFPNDAALAEATALGVEAILLKEAAADALLGCLRAVASGQHWVPSPTVSSAVEREQERRTKWESRSGLLTSRELEVLRLLEDGAANKEIGFTLGIAENTVKVHLQSIYRKFEVSTRSELLDLARGGATERRR
jgi:DNA-binding NarL/FixJ family response regulator